MLRPVVGVCNIAEEQRRNNAQTITLKSATASGAKISFAANEEDCKSISSDS